MKWFRRRGAQSTPRAEQQLRTELGMLRYFRSRVLGTMLSASAQERWPLFWRFSTPGVPRTESAAQNSPRCATLRSSHLHHNLISNLYILMCA